MSDNTNRLINETSPYLLQHAHNPVDWYPWGTEAFKKAHEKNCLIFLSIGYSTCHWCHEMAHDAFSDEETAKYLNENFVSIKVDREERPDIDEIYMLACQFLSENCGWPLNSIITTDKKPIFSTTYLPSKDAFGRPSLINVLKEINDMWKLDRNKVFDVANQVVDRIDALHKETAQQEIYTITLDKAFDIFVKLFDKDYGGFGKAPKFPSPFNLSYLLHWYKNTSRDYALEMVKITLNSMYNGGIFDHVGGGFHRYSTDSRWLIPHFEKTLYDQALISNTYIEAYQITNNELYADVAKKTLDFALNELFDNEGAFYSGSDADIEGEEGKFYIWSKDEIVKILQDDAEIFCIAYGITDQGNFVANKNILFISNSCENLSDEYGLSQAEIKQKLDACLHKLYEARNQRVRPNIDKKIITSWNGLMLKTLAFAAKVFDDDKYKTAAIKTYQYITKNLVTPDGHVFRSYTKEKNSLPGFLEDYSFLIYGILELYKLSSDDELLKVAQKITNKMISEFYDTINGGFFSTSLNSETILIKIKSPIDGALPAGNSIAVLVLLILGELTKKTDYIDLSNATFNCFGQSVNQFPVAYSQLLIAFLYSLKQI